ncbi:hypothetical protein [Halobacillus litoralis]|uniref:Uncharacterized protein n=1 Tax=Halobacillus litoralis TaxID=45668 RepID=A0A410MJ99_9BACI|nr:hypothetical protein [Halobacillus litoralis]QAS54773.1 hypothetical protein HLI_21180 [Halobacillus litoralis]
MNWENVFIGIAVIAVIVLIMFFIWAVWYPIKKLFLEYNPYNLFEKFGLLLGIGLLLFSMIAGLFSIWDETSDGFNNLLTIAGYLFAGAAVAANSNKKLLHMILYISSCVVVVSSPVYLYMNINGETLPVIEDYNGALAYAVLGIIITSEIINNHFSRRFKHCSNHTCSRPNREWKYLNFCTGCEQTYCKHCIDTHLKECENFNK